MISIKKLLAESDAPEQTGGEKLKHIEHLEDHPINDGAKGFDHAVGALEKVKHHILQNKNDSDLTMKPRCFASAPVTTA